MRISDWSSDVCSSDLVRWTSTRAENLMVDSHGRDHYTRCRMAFRSDGAILGLEVESIANLGAYMTAYGAGIAAYLYAGALSGAYAIPAVHSRVRGPSSNKIGRASCRGRVCQSV